MTGNVMGWQARLAGGRYTILRSCAVDVSSFRPGGSFDREPFVTPRHQVDPTPLHQLHQSGQRPGRLFPARWSVFTGALVNNYQRTHPHYAESGRSGRRIRLTPCDPDGAPRYS